VPGVRDVISIDPVAQGAFSAGGVVVVADNSWAAMQGRRALDITWDEGPHATESSQSLRQQFLVNASKPGKVVRNEGDANAALVSAAKKVDIVYEIPFAAHACMEPMNCTVHIRPDGAEAWVPTQAPQWAQDIIVGVTKLLPNPSSCIPR
jgi:isoquinoline 1-oxidoreductase beta subunit